MAVSTGAAILGGSAISAVGGALGGRAAAKGNDAAIDLERARLRELKPFRDSGVRALPQFEENIGEMPTYEGVLANLPNDPGYKFEMQQGRQAIEGTAAARGLLRSGRTLKDLVSYAQGLASQRAGDAFSRELNTFNNRQNQLLALIEAGRGASGTQSMLPQLAANSGAIRADTITGMANVGTNALQQLLLANQLRAPGGSVATAAPVVMGPSGPITNSATLSWN